MSNHAAPRRVRRTGWWRSARLRAALSLGVVLGIGSIGTFAYWTDDVEVSGTSFTAGSINLQVNDLETVTGYTSLNISNMVPGNSTAGILKIGNTGNSPVKYTGSAVATDGTITGLGVALVVKITGATAVTPASPKATCGGAALTGTGTSLNSGLVSPGRVLGAHSVESLCVQVTLPTDASTSLQNSSTSVAFTFSATSNLS